MNRRQLHPLHATRHGTWPPASHPLRRPQLHRKPWNEPAGRRSLLAAHVEAVLMAADEPLPVRRIAQVAEIADLDLVERLIAWLSASYARDRSGFEIASLAGGYRMMSRPDLRPALDTLLRPTSTVTLTPAILEVLVIIAHRQPLTRADIEAIRGAGCAEAIKQLTDQGYIKIVGQDDSLGRPFLFGTTRTFLDHFGLLSLAELPLRSDLALKPAEPEDMPEPEMSETIPVQSAEEQNALDSPENDEL